MLFDPYGSLLQQGQHHLLYRQMSHPNTIRRPVKSMHRRLQKSGLHRRPRQECPTHKRLPRCPVLFPQTIHRAAPRTPIARDLSAPYSLSPTELARHTKQFGAVISIRGHSAGSYSGIVWEEILAEFPNIEGNTVLTAIAFPHYFLTSSQYSAKRQRHLIHHLDDQLCVWTPSKADLVLVQQRGFKITCITGRKKYLGGAQHNHAHWTRVELPEGHHDIASLEHIPGVLPFEVYAQAPLRLISWCSFELDSHSRTLLRDLAIMWRKS